MSVSIVLFFRNESESFTRVIHSLFPSSCLSVLANEHLRGTVSKIDYFVQIFARALFLSAANSSTTFSNRQRDGSIR